MTRPVFFIDPQRLAGSQHAPGHRLVLGGEEGHHARRVRRLAAGEAVDLVDGCGHRVAAEVLGPAPDGLELVTTGPVLTEQGSGLVLVQALAKNDRDLMAVEMATELGVDTVIPWQADRSIVRWKGERGDKALAKWRRTVTAAAKQARRAAVPLVAGLHSTAELASCLGPGDRLVVLHEQATTSLVQVLQDADLTAREDVAPEEDRVAEPGGSGGRILLAVGPEGGISPEEVAVLESAGARTALLGRDVLRSSTAGAAAIAVIRALRGDWSAPGSEPLGR